jgi:hypothetical protein
MGREGEKIVLQTKFNLLLNTDKKLIWLERLWKLTKLVMQFPFREIVFINVTSYHNFGDRKYMALILFLKSSSSIYYFFL